MNLDYNERESLEIKKFDIFYCGRPLEGSKKKKVLVRRLDENQ